MDLKYIIIGGTRPTMKDINRHVIPSVATSWYSLGLELLDPEHEKSLEIIEEGNKHDIQYCCRKMFSKWLDTCDNATWDQLIDAIKRVNLSDTASKIESLLQQGKYIDSYIGVITSTVKLVTD